MMQKVATSVGKIVLYFVLMGLSVVGLMEYVLPVAEAQLGMAAAYPKMLTLGIVNFLGMSIPAMLLMSLLEGKSPVDIGLGMQRSLGDFLTGGLVGGFIFAAALAAAVFGGWARIDPDFSQLSLGAMAASTAGMALASAGEEIMMRGFVLQELMSKFSTAASVVVSSLLFAGLHAGQLIQSDMGAIGALNIFLASVLLSLAYLVTRTLWLPIGIHAGWNIIQGPMLGIDVSGNDMGSTWHPVTLSGPEMMTGGQFGFEASVFGLIGPTLGILMMIAMRKRA